MIRQRHPNELSFGGLDVDVRIDYTPFFDQLIAPHRPAPVLVQREGQIQLIKMNFSLVPSWSKEAKPRFATHNARLETVLEKPTWRDSFQKRHCLVPFTHFIEPIYHNEHAGYMVAFHAAKADMPLLAAGVWDAWRDPADGIRRESFAILTSVPPPFVAEVGHDRCPVFLGFESGKEWLHAESRSGETWRDFLSQQEGSELQVERYRPMKAGWEKRR